MSIQGTAGTARRIRDDRHKTLKGIAFWGFLFTASFVFGMMVVSPLLTATGFGEPKAANAETPAVYNLPPSPQPSTPSTAAAAPKNEDKKPSKAVAPDIELSVEPNRSSVSKPESPDTTIKENPDTNSAVTEPRENTSPLDGERPKATRRTNRTRRAPEKTDQDDPSGTYTVEPEKQLVPDEPERRDSTDDKPKAKNHRTNRRSHSTDTGARSGNKGSDVQKGESIDP